MDLLMDSHGLSTEQVLRQVSATYSAIIGRTLVIWNDLQEPSISLARLGCLQVMNH